MIVEPKVRGFICTTAHPAGCRENIKRQIDYIKAQPKAQGPQRVLVIGSSTGYGMASRIASTFSFGASTIGVMYEKPATDRRCATPGWYNTAAFEEYATEGGYYAKSINGDAFSQEIKKETIALIKKDLGQVDMVIYSLASPRRTDKDGITYNSVLKTTANDFTNKSLDLKTNEITQATITPATQEEVDSTVKVMGGEDWQDWIDEMVKEDVLSENAVTIAYSYIGPALTYPVYYNGTIGKAKEHLYQTSLTITDAYKAKGIKAYVSVNKALVTQASSAIPIVPLYFAILYRVMKEKGLHEGCIEQINRLFQEKLKADGALTDELGRIRLDDYEMQDDVQEQVIHSWDKVDSDNVKDLADLEGYWNDFYQMFGFRFDLDYSKDVDTAIAIPSIQG